jgi:mono/diheme cytochrome c family protein
MNAKTKRILWWAFVLAVLVAIFVTAPRVRRDIDVLAGFLPGNPRRGGELFYDRGCGGCHAIAGVGGKEASDLAHTHQTPSDLEDIAGAMWNHAPEMWATMSASGFQVPSLTPEDVADIMAFLFAAGYLEEEGDPENGRAVLTTKKCRTCHALGEEDDKLAPDLALWSSRVNPILWTTALWNHAPEMEEALEAEGMDWPELTQREVVDLLAYLRTIGGIARERGTLPGDPLEGRRLFRESCSQCHSAEGEGSDVGPDLSEGTGTRTLAGLSAAFWNHVPAMGESMRELGLSRPTFSEQEMADIITYLFAIRYFERPGDARVGADVYSRSCAKCHGDEAEGAEGPDLQHLGTGTSAVFLASTLWNHGPQMYDEARDRGLEWPLFQGHEMHDLISYLRSLEQ